MKKYILFTLFVAACFPPICIADVNPYVVGSSGIADDPCSCPASSYELCWTGDYSGDTDVACTGSGSSTTQGTVSGASIDTYTNFGISDPGTGGNYIAQFDASDDFLRWAAGTITGNANTVTMLIYATATTGTNSLFSLWEDVDTEWEGRVLVNNDLRNYHRGAGTGDTYDSSGTISDATWIVVRFSASVSAQELSTKIDSGSWETSSEGLDNFDAGPSYFAIGDAVFNTGMTDTVYVAYVWVSSSHEDSQ